MTKRVCILGFAMLLSVAGALAQDIIMLRTGDDIEALVQEIGTDEVKYKKFDNPNGPNYTLKKPEIFMIRYENGAKDVFTKQETDQGNQGNVVKQQNTTQGQPVVQQNSQSDIEDLKNEFYRIGNNDRAMSRFLAKHDPILYKRFASACSKSRGGKIVLYGGIGMTLLEITMIQIYPDYYKTWLYPLALSHLLIIEGIVFTSVAAGQKRSIKNEFADIHFGRRYSYQPALNFGLTANGMGLTFNF